jgi:hypothetical protein
MWWYNPNRDAGNCSAQIWQVKEGKKGQAGEKLCHRNVGQFRHGFGFTHHLSGDEQIQPPSLDDMPFIPQSNLLHCHLKDALCSGWS